jgi:hypothetical protein
MYFRVYSEQSTEGKHIEITDIKQINYKREIIYDLKDTLRLV